MTKQILLFLSILTIITSCGNKDVDKVKISASDGPLPVERGVNIAISYTDSGFLKAKVFAPLLERYSTEEKLESEMKKGITAYFYGPKGKITSYLKSKYAFRDEKARTLLVRNDVIVVNNKGDTIRTEEMIWDEKTDMISTDKAVQIHSPDKIIYGTGMESTTDFTHPKIFNIKGTVYLKQ
jgi:LPS export ABC transporter protein LptC